MSSPGCENDSSASREAKSEDAANEGILEKPPDILSEASTSVCIDERAGGDCELLPKPSKTHDISLGNNINTTMGEEKISSEAENADILIPGDVDQSSAATNLSDEIMTNIYASPLTRNIFDPSKTMTASFPPVDTDDNNSEMQEEDMVLKWDDDEEIDETNESVKDTDPSKEIPFITAKNDSYEKQIDITKDTSLVDEAEKKSYINKDTSLIDEAEKGNRLEDAEANADELAPDITPDDKTVSEQVINNFNKEESLDKDLMDEIDAQISQIGKEHKKENIEKDLMEEIDAQISQIGKDDKKTNIEKESVQEGAHTDKILIETVPSLTTFDSSKDELKAHLSKLDQHKEFDDVELKSSFSDKSNNLMDGDASNIPIDSIIANLDKIIDENDDEKVGTEEKVVENPLLVKEVHTPATDAVSVDAHAESTDSGKPLSSLLSEKGVIEKSSLLDKSDLPIAPVDPMEIDSTKEADDFLKTIDSEPIVDKNDVANSTEIDMDTSNLTVEKSLTPTSENNVKTAEDKELSIEDTDTNITLSENESFSEIIEPKNHNLKNADMMIEIPTQELIDCFDDSIDSLNNDTLSDITAAEMDTSKENTVDKEHEIKSEDKNETSSQDKSVEKETKIDQSMEIDENVTQDLGDKVISETSLTLAVAKDIEIPVMHDIAEPPLVVENVTESQVHASAGPDSTNENQSKIKDSLVTEVSIKPFGNENQQFNLESSKKDEETSTDGGQTSKKDETTPKEHELTTRDKSEPSKDSELVSQDKRASEEDGTDSKKDKPISEEDTELVSQDKRASDVDGTDSKKDKPISEEGTELVSQDKRASEVDGTDSKKDKPISEEDTLETKIDNLSKGKSHNSDDESALSVVIEKKMVSGNENESPKQASRTEDLTSKDQPAKNEDSAPKDAIISSKPQDVESKTENLTKDQDQTINEDQSMADTSDEVPEMTDSLGLLAESSRVIEDDEEQETSEHDEGDGDGDDEDDFDPDDESSNQMTAEHSEDSNAQHSETDQPKDKLEELQTNVLDAEIAQDSVEKEPETPEGDKEFSFEISEVVSATGETVEGVKDGEGEMEIEDDIVCDEVEVTSDTLGDDNDQLEEPSEAIDAPVPEPVDDTEKSKTDEPKKTSQSAEIETVKLSDTSDNEEAAGAAKQTDGSILKGLLAKKEEEAADSSKQSPSKKKKLEISKPRHVLSIVDLEESSSEDDVQEVKKETPKTPEQPSDVTKDVKDDVTSVNISGQIEIMSSGGNTSDIITKEGETVISGVPKPRTPHKPARLNTSEVTIKTASTAEPLVIPETKVDKVKEKPRLSLEVFSLDSDEEDAPPAKEPSPQPEPEKPHNRCINSACTSDPTVPYYPADRSIVAYYDANKKRKAMVCDTCAQAFAKRAQSLVEGIRNFTPLLELDMGRVCQELVEISDSDSEEEEVASEDGGGREPLGDKVAKMLESELANMLNEAWSKYKMDARLEETQLVLTADLEKLEKESQEIDKLLTQCQAATDKLRSDLYGTFEKEKIEDPPFVIFDTPDRSFSCPEAEVEDQVLKRRLSQASEPPRKRAAIPLGYTSLDSEAQASLPGAPQAGALEDSKPVVSSVTTPLPDPSPDNSKIDDDRDISVVKLSAESAPADLPPPGEISHPPVKVGMQVFAMRNAFGSWLKGRLVEVTPKGTTPATQFSMCRVKFENKSQKNAYKVLPARCLAYNEPAEVRMAIGTRVIALFKDALQSQTTGREAYYSGIVAEVPNPVNNYRYLVFFDDGYAQYVHHADTRLVCEFSNLVWEEVHPYSRDFVKQYLMAYPERPMVRLHTGQSLKTEWNGKWWVSRVLQVDASLVQVHFKEDNRTEWIYRGSTRLAPLYLELQAAERHRARPLPRNRLQNKVNMPYVEYTRSDEPAPEKPQPQSQTFVHAQAAAQQQQEEIRRQRAVAKKSTGAAAAASQPPPPPQIPLGAPTDTVTSRVVYYTPKNAVKPYKLVSHICSPKCKRNDVLALRDLRTYNPLAKPLLSGWERQLVRFKGHRQVMYRAPCGRRLRNMPELHRYLQAVQSDMGVDLFDFGSNTHCLAEFMLNKCIISKKDLSNGKENVPVPCVNYYDTSLPEFCSYNTERTPTEGVPLNLDPDFLCGCDCTDDCEDKSKCACWQLTLEGARTIGLEGKVGYEYRRLPEPLPSGIYECNSRCKCKSTCLNRVAQHPLQLKLQVFKTLNRGWGIRALNDVPKGAFLCVYAGNLLTDATANLDGLNEGDEYLAELDYIEVVEQMKEGFEDDIPDADKKLDKKESGKRSEENSDEEEMSSSDDEQEASKDEKEDGDFQPGYLFGPGITQFSKRLRKRKKDKTGDNKEGGKEKTEDDCITISDDEEVREPSRFMAQAGMGNEFISKYRSVRSHFGKDEACYIMDAKVQGNIGRYLNHSCSPNVFVQNVFVDTHDPRFPWVAFFALWPIRAGTELTWNYNYDVGSVPGKVLYCYCGAPNCRGRLL